MKTAVIKYTGNLRTEATHTLSGKQLITDAPTDNQGKGEAFSPTDLLSTALGCCMLTIMGIAVQKHAIDIEGTQVEITKIMESNPRRVGEIVVKMLFKKNYTEKERIVIENAALTCPVAKSLHPDLKQTVTFVYPE